MEKVSSIRHNMSTFFAKAGQKMKTYLSFQQTLQLNLLDFPLKLEVQVVFLFQQISVRSFKQENDSFQEFYN